MTNQTIPAPAQSLHEALRRRWRAQVDGLQYMFTASARQATCNEEILSWYAPTPGMSKFERGLWLHSVNLWAAEGRSLGPWRSHKLSNWWKNGAAGFLEEFECLAQVDLETLHLLAELFHSSKFRDFSHISAVLMFWKPDLFCHWNARMADMIHQGCDLSSEPALEAAAKVPFERHRSFMGEQWRPHGRRHPFNISGYVLWRSTIQGIAQGLSERTGRPWSLGETSIHFALHARPVDGLEL